MNKKRSHEITCKVCNIKFQGWGNGRYCSPECLKTNNYRFNMTRPVYRVNKLLAGEAHRAKTKELDYDLDLDYMMGLWDGCEGKCRITGRCFYLGDPAPYFVHPNAPSIDRIIPELGYTKGNVRFVTYQTNVALSEYGFDHLISFASDIVNMQSVSFQQR